MTEITPETTISTDKHTPPRKSRRLWWWLIPVILVAGAVTLVNTNDDVHNAIFKLKPPITKVNPVDGAVMIWIPAGEFIMGGKKELPPAHPFRDAEDTPLRKVYLDGYWVYRDEVTVAQFRKFCAATKYDRKRKSFISLDADDQIPISYVSWTEAEAYAKWAGGELPTGAQWEKAARGTDGRDYPWGRRWDNKRCNNSKVWEDTTKMGWRISIGIDNTMERPLPAGTVPGDISPYGVRDMAGNVSEYTRDLYYTPEIYTGYMSGKNPATPLPEKASDYVCVRGRNCYETKWGQAIMDSANAYTSFAVYAMQKHKLESDGEGQISTNAIGIRCVVTGNSPVRR